MKHSTFSNFSYPTGLPQ